MRKSPPTQISLRQTFSYESFIRDPYKFANFIHTQKRHPQTNLRDANMQWDFWSLNPKSLHQVTILFSDRRLPANYRHVNGYGSHTLSFVNAEGERFWCIDYAAKVELKSLLVVRVFPCLFC